MFPPTTVRLSEKSLGLGFDQSRRILAEDARIAEMQSQAHQQSTDELMDRFNALVKTQELEPDRAQRWERVVGQRSYM